MSRLICALSLFVAACSSSTSHTSVTMRVGGMAVSSSTLLVLPGTTLSFTGVTETTDQGVFPVSSNSEHPEYSAADVDISCTSPTKAPCTVEGNTATPQRPGTFEITAGPRRWTITALDVKVVELAPCGTVPVAPGERDVDVYAVGPEGRLKLAMPAAINGVQGRRVTISAPATFELRATVVGITGTCRLAVVATP